MVIANNITHERKKRLSSLGIAFKEIPTQKFPGVVTKKSPTQDFSSNSVKITTHQQRNEDIQFELFKGQKNELIHSRAETPNVEIRI
jgi:hypothetical protein